MNEQPTKSRRRRSMPTRIQLSFLLGVSLIIVLGLLANFFPFHIAKYLFGRGCYSGKFMEMTGLWQATTI